MSRSKREDSERGMTCQDGWRETDPPVSWRYVYGVGGWGVGGSAGGTGGSREKERKGKRKSVRYSDIRCNIDAKRGCYDLLFVCGDGVRGD